MVRRPARATGRHPEGIDPWPNFLGHQEGNGAISRTAPLPSKSGHLDNVMSWFSVKLTSVGGLVRMPGPSVAVVAGCAVLADDGDKSISEIAALMRRAPRGGAAAGPPSRASAPMPCSRPSSSPPHSEP